MRTKCYYSDCGQPIEYPEEYAGKVFPCPVCNRNMIFPSLNGFQWLKQTILFRIYFDMDSVNPDRNSPYFVINKFLTYLYRLFAIIYLMALPIALTITFIDSIREGTYDVIYWPFAAIFGWLAFYIYYKLVRIIFDIAEYLRQLTLK